MGARGSKRKKATYLGKKRGQEMHLNFGPLKNVTKRDVVGYGLDPPRAIRQMTRSKNAGDRRLGRYYLGEESRATRIRRAPRFGKRYQQPRTPGQRAASRLPKITYRQRAGEGYVPEPRRVFKRP